MRACRDGRGATVLVAGEAGLGKTSLLRTFAARVAAQADVLSGACDDLHTARTLGPFRDMFEPASSGPAPDRDHYIGRLRAALSRRDRPAVIMVDDAHWADDASLDIIRYLGRRLESLPGLLLVSYRPADLAEEHPLRRVLGSLPPSSTVRIDLRPLSDGTVGRLAEEAGRDPATVVAAVGGNPFFLAEVLASTGAEVPRTVRDAVLARVLALPEPTRRALEVLSVVPTGADRRLVEALLDSGSAVWLGYAERAGIVTSSGQHVAYRHELARRAVEAGLPSIVRLELNRRVLHRLIERGATASRLVHHAAAAGEMASAARYAVDAAEEAASAEAHSETSACCRLALDRSDILDRHTVARLHGLATRALYALGRFGEAADHAEQAVAVWEGLGDAPRDLADVLLVSSRMHTMNGLPDAARTTAERAVALLRPLGPSRALAHACSTMGNLETVEANGAAAVRWCREALALAEDLDLPDVAVHGRVYLGLARVGVGELSGLDDVRAAIELAERIDHGDYLCRASSNLATVLLWLGRHAEAAGWLDRAEAAAREHGLDYVLFHVLAGRSSLDLFFGRWAEAEQRLRRQLRTDRDPAAMMTLPLALLGRLLARRGDPEAAALIDRSWQLAKRSRQAHRLAIAGGAVLEQAWLAGDEATVRSVSEVLEPVAVRANLLYLRGEIARHLRRIGVGAAAFDGCPPGFAAGIDGDPAAAAAAWQRAGNPYEQALEETECPDEATAFAGINRLDRLGATAAANRCRRRLLERGITGVPRGPRTSTRAHPAGLTARQQDVLALLAEGLTTAQIAERLFLSPRTVDNHIADLVGRLGVDNRREAVTVAGDAGWLPAGDRATRHGQPR